MRNAAFIGLFVLFAACSQETKKEETSPVKRVTEESEFTNNLRSITLRKGVAGIYKVQEMLSLSVKDSASASEMPSKTEKVFSLLEEDLQKTRALRNGCYGQISYNNDTSNFKFEGFALIRKVPATPPAKAKVVVLEEDRMLVYNFYGHYSELYKGYAELRNYMSSKKLEPKGPMREYYYTDPRTEPDPSKWRTIIMVPLGKRN